MSDTSLELRHPLPHEKSELLRRGVIIAYTAFQDFRHATEANKTYDPSVQESSRGKLKSKVVELDKHVDQVFSWLFNGFMKNTMYVALNPAEPALTMPLPKEKNGPHPDHRALFTLRQKAIGGPVPRALDLCSQVFTDGSFRAEQAELLLPDVEGRQLSFSAIALSVPSEIIKDGAHALQYASLAEVPVGKRVLSLGAPALPLSTQASDSSNEELLSYRSETFEADDMLHQMKLDVMMLGTLVYTRAAGVNYGMSAETGQAAADRLEEVIALTRIAMQQMSITLMRRPPQEGAPESSMAAGS